VKAPIIARHLLALDVALIGGLLVVIITGRAGIIAAALGIHGGSKSGASREATDRADRRRAVAAMFGARRRQTEAQRSKSNRAGNDGFSDPHDINLRIAGDPA
jgi:hypothetical protein